MFPITIPLITQRFQSIFFGMKTEEELEILRLRSRAWRAANPERAKEIGRASSKRQLAAKAVAEGREPGRIGRQSQISPEEKQARRKALDDIHNAKKKVFAAEKALAEGREPGRVGRPPRLTAEEKEISRLTHNKHSSKKSLAKRTARRAARAIENGRVPGQAGSLRVLSDEERIVGRRASYAKWRSNNLEEVRERDKVVQKARTAARALAEGRVPGVLGHLATFTAEDLAIYLARWPREKSVYHARAKTQNSRAKRFGATGSITAMDVQEAYIEQMGYCGFCAQPFGDEIPEIDHWVPLVKGGSNDPENIKLLHMRCNRTKGGKHPDDFGLLASPRPAAKKGD